MVATSISSSTMACHEETVEKWSVPSGGRSDPESFKAIDTYTYIKNHTNSPYVSKMHYDCPYEGWALAIIFVE